jgi:hypothetical protein
MIEKADKKQPTIKVTELTPLRSDFRPHLIIHSQREVTLGLDCAVTECALFIVSPLNETVGRTGYHR